MNNGISVQMIFSPQNCTLELLDKTLTPDRRSLANGILAQVEDSLKTKASHYNLIIGPRGSGKTHVLAFIRKMLEANTSLKVIRLSEEERGITNLLDFLLACLRAAGIPIETVVSRIRSETRTTPQDTAIDYFCEVTDGRSALIMIENLANLFHDLEESAISDLRGFFQEHPFISVIASSIALFSNSSQADHPFYGFFNLHPLTPLSRNDAREYLLALALAKGDLKLAATLRKRHAQARVNAIYDLTGGNHRLLAMLSIFLSADGLEELVDPFIHMADRELTPYYQQRLDRLSPQQNKLLQTIADHHGRVLNRRSLKGSPLSVNEIANLTFLSPSTVSRQLYDLLAGGYVHRTQEGRESFYELKEPLLRLVLDLKEGHDGQPLSIIVSLLKNWYDAQELQQLEKIAPEHARCYYQAAYQAALEDIQYTKTDRYAALGIQMDIQNNMQESQTQGEELLLNRGWKCIQEGDYTAALEKFEQLLQRDSLEVQELIAMALISKGFTLKGLGRYEEALSAFDQVVDRFSESDKAELQGMVARVLNSKGFTLGELERYEEEIGAYNQVVERFSESDQKELQEEVALALTYKGVTLRELERYQEALSAYEQVLEQYSESGWPELQKWVAKALVNKGVTLGKLGRYEEKLSAYEQVIERFSESDRIELQEWAAKALVNKGVTFGELGRYEEALSVYKQVIERYSESDRIELQGIIAVALNNKGLILDDLGKHSEALTAFNSALQSHPDFPNALAGAILAFIHLKQKEEALKSLSDMLRKVPMSHDIRTTLASALIDSLLQDEKRLKQVIEIYQPDQKSLVAGLTKWVQNQLPLSQKDAEKLEPACLTLVSAFNSIPEAEPALQILQAARLDAMGDRKALLSLPIELRQLVERAKEESIGKESTGK